MHGIVKDEGTGAPDRESKLPGPFQNKFRTGKMLKCDQIYILNWTGK